MGLIWKRDYVAPLTWDEFCFWQRCPLPFGWAIVAEPSPPTLRSANRDTEKE